MTRDELLELSAERDLWAARMLEASRAAYRAGYGDGQADERIEADRLWAGRPGRRVMASGSLAGVEARRWHLCCRPCRLAGHRDGCEDCEDRTRETFSNPMRSDHTGNDHRRERAA